MVILERDDARSLDRARRLLKDRQLIVPRPATAGKALGARRSRPCGAGKRRATIRDGARRAPQPRNDAPRHAPMKITRIIDAFGYVIYATLAVLAVWGVYNAILLYRNLRKKSLADAGPLTGR